MLGFFFSIDDTLFFNVNISAVPEFFFSINAVSPTSSSPLKGRGNRHGKDARRPRQG